MDPMDLFNDRRTAPEPESGMVEQDPEREVVPEQMSEEAIIGSLRFPSANPGEGTMIVPRVRDRDLCRHCLQPMLAHGAGFEHHVPERMTSGQRTPGVHSDVEDGRSRSTQPSGLRPTHRRDIG